MSHPLCPVRGRGLLAALVLLSLGVSHTTAQELQYPLSIAVQESGTVYLADRNLPGIWKLEGDQLKVVFQGSKKFRTPLNAVRSVAIDGDGNLLAGDPATREIYRFDENGKATPLTDEGKGYGQVGIPMDIVVDENGDLIVADLEIHRIVKIPKDGGKAEVLAEVVAPRGLFYDAQKQLWVVSGRRLVRIAPDGKQETVVDEGTFEFPHTVVVDQAGVAYVCDGYARAIWKVEAGKKPAKLASGDPFVNPVGLEIQGGKLFVADPRARGVFEVDTSGKVSKREMKLAE